MTALLLLLSCSQTPTPEAGDSLDWQGCPADQDGSEAPSPLEGGQAEGWLCPVGDQDWYAFEVDAARPLLRVRLGLDAPVSPLQLSYSLYDPGGAVLGGPSAEEAATANAELYIVHEPGASGLLALRDAGGDAQDHRHPYLLELEAVPEPDGNEPNDSAEQATQLSSTTAWIASRGDQDWYSVDSPGLALLRMELDASQVNTSLSWTLVAPSGEEEASELVEQGLASELLALDQAGTWLLVVEAADGLGFDLERSYQLSLGLDEEPDLLEDNDHPEQATELGSGSCGPSWQELSPLNSYLGSPGDVDWYGLDLSGCEGGLLQAELVFESPELLDPSLEPVLRFVRPDPKASCSLDQDCQALSRSCSSDLDCAGFGNNCLPEGQCAGAGVCLPEQVCGATVLAEVGFQVEGEILAAIPLEDQERMYLALGDHQGSAYSLASSYSLAASLREEPDAHEPNGVYTAGEPGSVQADQHKQLAVEVPVHDCSVPSCCMEGSTDTGDCCPEGEDCCTPTDCCDGGTWVEGVLASSYDQDWFSFEHPCPGEDCNLRLHYAVDSGPVDVYSMLLHNESLFYDGLIPVGEVELNPALDGHYGGLEEDDQCLYAYQKHSGKRSYHLAFRDTTWGAEEGVGRWDHDADQSYRFCVEKVSQECLSPCEVADNGRCDSP